MIGAIWTVMWLGVFGCGQPLYLQYDFGQAYHSARSTQAALDRPSVQDAGYVLSGIEGIELRQRVIEESTDAETGIAEFVQSFTTN